MSGLSSRLLSPLERVPFVRKAREPVSSAARHVTESGISLAHDAMVRSPALDRAVGHLSGPFVKHRFNAPPAPGAATGPRALSADTIEEARALMARHFRPEEGKILVGIAGTGRETVHTFVVSGVRDDGAVRITQALAQVTEVPEDRRGLGGAVSGLLDRWLGNAPGRMQGVVEEDWATYARRSGRNTVAVLQLEADPRRVQEALEDLKRFVGKPYDRTLLASETATAASQAGFYCTEVSSWFLNRIRPGTVKPSRLMGYPVYQVSDHMRATEVHGGPLKVLYNGDDRLDFRALDPFPRTP